MLDPHKLIIGSTLLYDGKPDNVTAIDLDLDDEGEPLVSFSDSSPVELNYGRVSPIVLSERNLADLGFYTFKHSFRGDAWRKVTNHIHYRYIDVFLRDDTALVTISEQPYAEIAIGRIIYLHELQLILKILK